MAMQYILTLASQFRLADSISSPAYTETCMRLLFKIKHVSLFD